MTSERNHTTGNAQRWTDRAGGVLGWALAAAMFSVFALEARAQSPAPQQAHAAQAQAPFAKVGDVVITQQEYDAAYARASRAKFYHGKPPEAEVAALQREVAKGMVDEILLVKEAKRRKLVPDAKAVQQTIDQYDQQYGKSEQWQKNRAKMLPELKAKLERDNLLEQVRASAKSVGQPSEKQLQQYWEAHKDKFTEPEQIRVSMILLKVDPSSPQAKWDATREEGKAIVKRLKGGGAKFEELAKIHSADKSAEKGGDMGYLHRGMLPDSAQEAIDKLKAGQISDDVVMLEGIAVFRLDDRKAAKLNPLDKVRERAKDLWLRDKGEEAYTQMLARLHKETPVKMDESRFLPLAVAKGAAETKGVKAAAR